MTWAPDTHRLFSHTFHSCDFLRKRKDHKNLSNYLIGTKRFFYNHTSPVCHRRKLTDKEEEVILFNPPPPPQK